MTTITFDTLEFTEQLKASGVPEDQAKGHAKAMARVLEQVEESRLKELATKGDIQQLETKIAELRAEIVKWMFGVAAGQAMFIIAILKLFPSH
ncbi:MAG: CCDC90 family protein [Magnetococcus sp. THC-1_WYH]